jgi:hypothetical protein
MKVVRTVFNGGQEETYGNATRLVPTQPYTTYSLKVTRLSHSEMVGDAARGAPHRFHPPHAPRRQPVPERTWSRAAQPPGGMKLAEKESKAPVGGYACVTPAAAPWGVRGVSTRDATTRAQGTG